MGVSTHFDEIGMPIRGPDDLGVYVKEAFTTGVRHKVPARMGGTYYQLAVPEGPEIWVAVNTAGEVEGFTPYFRAGNKNRVSIRNRVENPDWRYEGGFYAWAAGENAEDEGTSFPFVFDCPDYAIHAGGKFPDPALVTLTGFVHNMQIFMDEDDFYKCQDKDFHLAAESFIPTGLFNEKLEKNDPPAATALFAGRLEETGTIKNSMTGKAFFRARIKTLALTMDIVADPKQLESIPGKGNIVQVSAWLVGDWAEH